MKLLKIGLLSASLAFAFVLLSACGGPQSSDKSVSSIAKSDKLDFANQTYTVVYLENSDNSDKIVVAGGFDIKVNMSNNLVDVHDDDDNYLAQFNLPSGKKIDTQNFGKGDKQITVKQNDSVIATGKDLIVTTVGRTLIEVHDKTADGDYEAQNEMKDSDVISVDVSADENSSSSESSTAMASTPKQSDSQVGNTDLSGTVSYPSDSAIKSISTYRDYLNMADKIYKAYYDDAYSVLYNDPSQETSLQQIKKQTDDGIKQAEASYGSMKNMRIVGKSTSVDYLKNLRDSMKDYVDSLRSAIQ